MYCLLSINLSSILRLKLFYLHHTHSKRQKTKVCKPIKWELTVFSMFYTVHFLFPLTVQYEHCEKVEQSIKIMNTYIISLSLSHICMNQEKTNYKQARLTVAFFEPDAKFSPDFYSFCLY